MVPYDDSSVLPDLRKKNSGRKKSYPILIALILLWANFLPSSQPPNTITLRVGCIARVWDNTNSQSYFLKIH